MKGNDEIEKCGQYDSPVLALNKVKHPLVTAHPLKSNMDERYMKSLENS